MGNYGSLTMQKIVILNNTDMSTTNVIINNISEKITYIPRKTLVTKTLGVVTTVIIR